MSDVRLLTIENSSSAWDELSGRLDAFVTAWEGGTPPALADFLPDPAAALRHMSLVELIKIDLEFRWQNNAEPRKLDEYAAEFPEIIEQGGLPCDLIYEEFHIRRQCGDHPDADDYCKRYPKQAEELGKLLGLESPAVSTMLLDRTTAQEIQPGDRIDDFDLLTKLGKGAFASVYLARQISMQRIVAVKVSSDKGLEPQTMAQLDHPHIVRVYDQRILPERKLRLLYMQYIPGGTLEGVVTVMRALPPAERSGQAMLDSLDEALARRGETPPGDSLIRRRLAACSWPEAVCWIGARLAGALDYAHAHGVLHRDIKPANVLVAGDGSPKLADFNISFSAALEGTTPAAYFGGSLAYMSPEQLEACNPGNARQADELDCRSDIYSLGVMLWELLTGSRPFADDPIKKQWSETLEQMTKLRREGVTPWAIAHLPGNCPPGLDEILVRCLAPDREARPACGAELARELQLCLGKRTQQLLRPRPGSLRRVVQRHPFTFMLLAGLAPNAFLSVLNIAYNLPEIVAQFSPEAQELFRSVQLLVVNGVAYVGGVSLLYFLAIPVLIGAKCIREQVAIEAADIKRARRRCLTYGDLVALVSGTLWLITSAVFPGWVHLQFGERSAVEMRHYLHFAASQLLSGLIAGTLCFFVVTFVMVRFIYPMMVRCHAGDPDEGAQVAALTDRTWRYFGLAVAAPFLAVIVLSVIGTQMGMAIGVLGMVGLAGFILNFFLALAIRKDLEALSLALAPSGRLEQAAMSDSFWS